MLAAGRHAVARDLLRRRQVARRRSRAALAARHQVLQRRERARARAPRRARGRRGRARRRCRCASTRTSTRGTHPYISTGLAGNKFGIPHGRALEVYRARRRACRNLRVTGIDCHIGSQILETAPLDEALERVLELVDALARRRASRSSTSTSAAASASATATRRRPTCARYCARLVRRLAGRGLQVLLEPGRAIVGNAGRAAHARRVPQARQGEALRGGRRLDERADPPRALRGVARHRRRWRGAARGRAALRRGGPGVRVLRRARHRSRRWRSPQGDLLAILSAGAYAMAMASNYNSRPRPCEVLVDAGAARSRVRARESVESLFAARARRSTPRAPLKTSSRRTLVSYRYQLRLESSQIVTLDIARISPLCA